jgi:hypothetical protein
MQERAESLEKVAATNDAQPLPPETATGMALGAQIAPAHPAAIGTGRVGADMACGVDLTPAPARHDDAWWRGCRGLWARVPGGLTGGAGRLVDEAHKGFRLAAARAPWWRRVSGGTVTRPRPLEHEAQPEQGKQHQLGEQESRDHGKTPSYRW